MWAAYIGNIDIFKLLFEKGAKVHSTGCIYIKHPKYGETHYGNILTIAVGNKNMEMVEYIINRIKMNVDEIEYNPETKSRDGWTALLWACTNADLIISKYLVEHGANVNYQEKDKSNTPLSIAAYTGNIDLVKYLISKGANINFSYDGYDALRYASRANNQEIYNYLEDIKSTVYISDKTNNDYSKVECIAGDWDYGAAKYNEIKTNTKHCFSCTIDNIGKINSSYYALIKTLEYDRYSDKHEGGLIYVIFSKRPKINTGEVVILSCRYAGLINYKDKNGNIISVPKFIADKMRKRITPFGY